MQSPALQSYTYFKNIQRYQKPTSRIVSVASEIPENRVDNETLVDMIDAPPEIKKMLPTLIYRTTKCKTRAYSEPGTSPSDLAVAAALKALDRCELTLADIDTLIFSSTDMDMLEPATANIVQQKLGLDMLNSFDVTNACNSFLQAINVANSMITTGAARNVLICSGEIGSYVANRQINSLDELDVKMGGLTLGDAGAAMILSASDGNKGILEINLMNLGEHWEQCHAPENTAWRPSGGLIHGWFYLDMPKLAKVAKLHTEAYFREYMMVRMLLEGDALFYNNIDQIIPHQISRKFIENTVGKFGYDLSKVPIVADLLGNTASTSIPLVLSQLIEEKTLSFGSGQEVMFYGAASGFGIGHVRVRL
ncbi:Beta-ketoacyl-acyl-carrier-protein synthase I [Chlorobaculum parvum NCIB 8327]|uniref:Beta-ketoacyl-acyl-carrier-protein synthase I n=1 Tax=Chlorobaculum parvum (strain DSM 263 / NCIMB 8327) TaxID=517417 RepID=B3QMY4_CHLP8|nr:3-oxoacyl-[acyl-carrier-protein] synthase III C-terminal domain-containing protein [Chlorobaculum parvum]ACF11287.1 Beta-ketoacyl-acyl-carrier-protein synthase I [Chlorobaculum parvum NCIB 8327]